MSNAPNLKRAVPDSIIKCASSSAVSRSTDILLHMPSGRRQLGNLNLALCKVVFVRCVAVVYSLTTSCSTANRAGFSKTW